MSQELTASIWRALDAADGDSIMAVYELGEALKAETETRNAALAALMPSLLAAVRSLTAPFLEVVRDWEADRVAQALREWTDPRENPQRVHRLEATIMPAFVLALADAVAAEVPAWRAARSDDRPLEA